jgi:biotin carboxyl carrier protein
MKYFVRVAGQEVEVVVDGEHASIGGAELWARLTEVDATPVRTLTIGDAVHRVIVENGANRGEYTLGLDGFHLVVEAVDERARAIRALAGATAPAKGPAPLVAPMPGMVVRVNVQVGDQVQAGQGLVVMEAMKMENELRAQSSGTVKRVLASPGTAVEKGVLLLELE